MRAQRRSAASTLSTIGDGAYWDTIVAQWPDDRSTRFLRSFSDDVNRRLLASWQLPHVGKLLKTDLFDEAVGGGLYPTLSELAEVVVGVDLSKVTVRTALARYPALEGHVCDIRSLPFADGSFDLVFSNSSLDHFPSEGDLFAGVHEIARVLTPGGTLVITLDNPRNPVVALRKVLPFGVLNRLGLMPYRVGVTCDKRTLVAVLRRSGFDVLEVTAIMHFPRLLARLLGLAARPNRTADLLRTIGRTESLARLPTRFVTGQFVAARAVRVADSPGSPPVLRPTAG